MIMMDIIMFVKSGYLAFDGYIYHLNQFRHDYSFGSSSLEGVEGRLSGDGADRQQMSTQENITFTLTCS